MRGGFVAADPDVRPQSLDVWGGLVCLIPDTCFACVELGARLVEQVVLQKVVDWAHPMWRENHIYIIEESEQGFPRLEVAVHRLEGCSLAKGEKGWHEGISLFPAFSLQNFVGLAAVVVPKMWWHKIAEQMASKCWPPPPPQVLVTCWRVLWCHKLRCHQ